MSHALTTFFEPRQIAVIGASAVAGKSGYVVVANILANGYEGKIYPVNPRGGQILGLPVTRSISELPEGIDVAVIILPAEHTVQALRECAAKGIRHAVLLAGGFAEVDEGRAKLQEELVDVLKKTGIRTLGPNTSGHTSTPFKFTSSLFPLGKIRPGRVSFIAQTGNFATHTMKYILTGEHFGPCRVIGLGNKIDVEESEALEYLGQDPETSAIIIYVESLKNPRRFLEIAGKVTRRKPVVMLKGGATEAGRKAADAHTAAMGSEDRIVDGMLRQAGVVRIHEYTHLILAAKAFSTLPPLQGNRVSFLAPSGAMLTVLSDYCMRNGLAIPDLQPETVRRLQEISPALIRMRNPVDIWPSCGVHGVEFGYREGMEAVLRDPNIDAVVPIIMLTKDIGVPSPDFIYDLSRKYPEKPVLLAFSAAKECMDQYKDSLEPRGVPTYPDIEQPFETLSILARCRAALNRPR